MAALSRGCKPRIYMPAISNSQGPKGEGVPGAPEMFAVDPGAPRISIPGDRELSRETKPSSKYQGLEIADSK